MGNVTENFLEKEEVRKYFSYAQFLYNLLGNERMSLTLENYIKNNF